MRPLLVLVLAAICACQQPAEKLDVDVLSLGRGPEESNAAPRVTRTSPPPLLARATITFSPAGMVTRSEVRSVIISVDVSGARGGELALELVAPDGTMYLRPTQPLLADPFVTQHFDFAIPVAGTWIDSMDLSGRWDTHVMLGDAELLHETFELMP